MKRKVLIIKGYSKDKIELTNDRQILELYTKFFASNAGGVYDKKSEILTLEEPTLEELKKYDTELNDLDSLIVVLLGHGANKEGKQVFQLKKDLFIQPGKLTYEVEKKLFIVESCRNIIDFNINIEDLNELIPKFRHGGVISMPKTKEQAKDLYNNFLMELDSEITYVFSSNIGESAYNYYFIHYLIKVSRELHEHSQNYIHTIKDIFDKTTNEVIKLTGGKQTPIIQGPANFPFVVSII
ncbi:MAG: hypothetical protein N4A35_00150 [Flavobacteriales bacterium]|jgi:hypothetical protein|nr:hypothetical protein [Flavobacteriales bacterium]